MAAKTAPENDPPLEDEAVESAPKKPATAASPTPAEPVKQQHSSLLVRTARSMGFSQADLDNFPSSDIWEEIHRINAAEAARARPVAAEKKADPEPDAEYDWNSEEVAGVPGLKAHLQKQAKELKELKATKAEIDEIKKANAATSNQRIEEMLDNAFASLPAKFHTLLGKGDLAEISDEKMRKRRFAIIREAGVNPSLVTQRALDRKLLEAAEVLLPTAAEPEPEVEEPNGYLAGVNGAKKTPPKDPATGRFTAEDFEKGKVAKPSGKKTGMESLDAVEQTRAYLRQNGDPRGFKPAIAFDGDDGLPD